MLYYCRHEYCTGRLKYSWSWSFCKFLGPSYIYLQKSTVPAEFNDIARICHVCIVKRKNSFFFLFFFVFDIHISIKAFFKSIANKAIKFVNLFYSVFSISTIDVWPTDVRAGREERQVCQRVGAANVLLQMLQSTWNALFITDLSFTEWIRFRFI